MTSAYLHKAIGSAQLILWNDEGGYGPEGGGEEAVGEAQRRDSNIGGQPNQRLEPLLNVQDIFSVYHLLRQWKIIFFRAVDPDPHSYSHLGHGGKKWKIMPEKMQANW